MDSDSGLPVMLPAACILDRFQMPYELTIVLVHRTQDWLMEYPVCGSARAPGDRSGWRPRRTYLVLSLR
jgi:phosphoribosylaminoimidazole carboxylase